jgi:hypothetical protein
VIGVLSITILSFDENKKAIIEKLFLKSRRKLMRHVSYITTKSMDEKDKIPCRQY